MHSLTMLFVKWQKCSWPHQVGRSTRWELHQSKSFNIGNNWFYIPPGWHLPKALLRRAQFVGIVGFIVLRVAFMIPRGFQHMPLWITSAHECFHGFGAFALSLSFSFCLSALSSQFLLSPPCHTPGLLHILLSGNGGRRDSPRRLHSDSALYCRGAFSWYGDWGCQSLPPEGDWRACHNLKGIHSKNIFTWRWGFTCISLCGPQPTFLWAQDWVFVLSFFSPLFFQSSYVTYATAHHKRLDKCLWYLCTKWRMSHVWLKW